MPKRKQPQKQILSTTNKRIKKEDEPFRLLDLPPEVIDCVLEHATYLQDCLIDGSLNNRTFDDIMAEPVSRSCHIIRNRIIGIIKARCAWIRVCCNVPQLRKALFDEAASYVPVVSKKYRPFLELDTPTIDLFIGSSVVTAAGERAIESPQKSFMFPFSHRVWLELLQDIQLSIRRAAHHVDLPVKHIALRCNKMSVPMESNLQSRIVPAFLALRCFTKVGFFGQALLSQLNDASAEQLKYMSIRSGSDHRMPAECTDLTHIYERIKYFEEGDHVEDSALVALYSYARLIMVTHQIRNPKSYHEPSEQDDHLYHQGVARLCIEIFERVCLALNFCYELEGVERLRDQIDKAPWWRFDVLLRLQKAAFSLRLKERAKLHRLLRRIYILRARVEAGLELDDTDENVILEDESQYFGLLGEGIVHDKIATKLEDILESTTAEASKFRIQHAFEDSYIEIHNAEGTGYFWAGYEWMLNFWGGRTMLQYLPMVRATAIAIGLPEDIEAGNIEPDVQYCGKSCNCIVF